MTTPEQRPTVGRIVHYVSYGTPGGEYTRQCRAAIVAEVPLVDQAQPPDLLAEGEELLARGRVGLVVLNPSGVLFTEADQDEDDHAGGTWHWPERV